MKGPDALHAGAFRAVRRAVGAAPRETRRLRFKGIKRKEDVGQAPGGNLATPCGIARNSKDRMGLSATSL